MQGEQHQGAGLKYLTILPDEYDPDASYPLLILLHGFGANMEDLASLAPAISRTGYVYAYPNAPISFDLGGGQVGYGWTSPRGLASPEEVQVAEDLLDAFFEEVFEQFKVTASNCILAGFSQGGGMTYRCGLRRLDPFAGLVALSASLQDPQELEARLPEDRSQRIFVAHGLLDPLIAADRARAAREFLEGVGYHPDYHEYDMAHVISMDVLNDLIPWMAKVLPPLQVAR